MMNAIHKQSVLIVLMATLAIVAVTPALYAVDVWREGVLYRDEWGTPHVYAENPFAMAYVFGYAQAEDHAEHILLAYRMANGKLAAVLGETYADSDAFSLKMGHGQLAEQALAVADPVTRALCEGFALGINAWLVDNAEATPPWTDGVQPQDVLAYWHAFLMSMAPFELPDVFRRAPAITSGNAWATSAERSTEGRPTLVMNPHQNHQHFFQWYEARLVMGDMNIHGATLRGLPVLLQGHNDYLGWALTPNWSNFADMFTEEFEGPPPANPRDPRVRPYDGTHDQAMLLYYMSHTKPYHIRTDGGMETRHVPALLGDRGPIFEDGAHGLNSWYIGGYTDFGGLRQLVEMARAQHIDAFWSALTMHQIPCFHIIYADSANNIFYLYNTKAGIRMIPTTGLDNNEDDPFLTQTWDGPVPASLSAVAWREVFAPAQLPTILNPPAGFIQACGNPPWSVTMPSPLEPSAWPQWLFYDRETYRAARVRQLLRSGARSFRDHQSMLFDVVVPAALDMVPAILRAAELRRDRVSNAHPDFWRGIELLRDWNYIAEVNATGMTFYHLWWQFARTAAGNHFPSENAFYEAANNDVPLAQDIMLRAVEEAARKLRNDYGSLEVPWGDVHRIRRGRRNEPLPGAQSGEPIFVAADYTVERDQLIANYGYGFAMVTQFGERPRSVSLLPFGTSMNENSPHYEDQMDLMLERRFKRVRFDDDDVLRYADRAVGKRITLLPLGVPGAVTMHSPTVIHARLHTEIEPPADLPRDVMPFSLFIRPERTPEYAPIALELSIHIPEALCDANALHELQLYRYEPGLPWRPVDMQHTDAYGRIVYAYDETPAHWYAVLGPPSAAGPERYRDDDTILEAYRHDTDPVGLDALLTRHETQSVVGQEERRIFRLERHDAPESVPAPEEIETPAPTAEMDAPGRTFRIERLDEEDAATTAPSRRSPLAGIPGMHFGPATRTDTDAATGDEDGRVFRIERHDQPPPEPEAPTETAPEPTPEPAAPLAAEPDISPAPTLPEVSEPTPVPEQEPTPETVEEPEETEAGEPAATRLEEELERQRSRPPLPDNIPQDPAFVFGPARQRQDDGPQPETSDRVFHIERHD